MNEQANITNHDSLGKSSTDIESGSEEWWAKVEEKEKEWWLKMKKKIDRIMGTALLFILAITVAGWLTIWLTLSK